jgi:hypothetical protein
MKVKYPNVTVDFSNIDGNAFVLLGTVRKAMHRAKISDDKIAEFTTEAQSGDYDHLLQTCMRWVNVE